VGDELPGAHDHRARSAHGYSNRVPRADVPHSRQPEVTAHTRPTRKVETDDVE